MQAMILAAGLGMRLRPFTLARPKAMLLVGDQPLLEHTLTLLRHHDFRDVVINTHYLPESITTRFGDGSQLGMQIAYSFEPQLLGTAGAVKKVGSHFTEPFAVIYGDVLTDLDLTAMLQHHREHGAIATLGVYDVEDPWLRGIVEADGDGRITRLVEKPARHEAFSNLANAGVYILEPEIVYHIPPDVPYDFAQDLFPDLLREGFELQAYDVTSYLVDIGSPEKYRQAQRDWAAGFVKSN
jgi:mannose-1-phosphate guanylyltransferase/phosphomannomutase